MGMEIWYEQSYKKRYCHEPYQEGYVIGTLEVLLKTGEIIDQENVEDEEEGKRYLDNWKLGWKQGWEKGYDQGKKMGMMMRWVEDDIISITDAADYMDTSVKEFEMQLDKIKNERRKCRESKIE